MTESLMQVDAHAFDGVPARVFSFEHLIAIMLQTNRPKDRQRLALLAGNAGIDRARLDDILNRHGLSAAWKTLPLLS